MISMMRSFVIVCLIGSAIAFTPVVKTKVAFRKTLLFALPEYLDLPDAAYPARIAEEASKAVDKIPDVSKVVDSVVPSVSDFAKEIAAATPSIGQAVNVAGVSNAVSSAATSATSAASGVTGGAAKAVDAASQALDSSSLPSVSLPSVDLPSVDLPSVDFGLDPTLIAAGVAVLAIGAFVASSSGGTNSEAPTSSTDKSPTPSKAAVEPEIVPSTSTSNSKSSPPKTTEPKKGTKSDTDLSIPYDAAALLAYKEKKGSDSVDQSDFEKFKSEYYKEAVAEVIKKKKAREGGK